MEREHSCVVRSNLHAWKTGKNLLSTYQSKYGLNSSNVTQIGTIPESVDSFDHS